MQLYDLHSTRKLKEQTCQSFIERKLHDLQRYMHTSQGSKASRLRQVRLRPKEMPDLRDIHKVGWPLVPVLRVQAADKAEEPEVQGKAARRCEKEYGRKSCASRSGVTFRFEHCHR